MQEQQANAFIDLLLPAAVITLHKLMDLWHVAEIPFPAALIQQIWSNLESADNTG